MVEMKDKNNTNLAIETVYHSLNEMKRVDYMKNITLTKRKDVCKK